MILREVFIGIILFLVALHIAFAYAAVKIPSYNGPYPYSVYQDDCKNPYVTQVHGVCER